jgi:hypothetical protein
MSLHHYAPVFSEGLKLVNNEHPMVWMEIIDITSNPTAISSEIQGISTDLRELITSISDIVE